LTIISFLTNFSSDTFFIQDIFAYLYKRTLYGSSGAGEWQNVICLFC